MIVHSLIFSISPILDGNLDRGILDCAQTNSSENGAWWTVDLGSVHGIKAVTITNSLGKRMDTGVIEGHKLFKHQMKNSTFFKNHC